MPQIHPLPLARCPPSNAFSFDSRAFAGIALHLLHPLPLELNCEANLAASPIFRSCNLVYFVQPIYHPCLYSNNCERMPGEDFVPIKLSHDQADGSSYHLQSIIEIADVPLGFQAQCIAFPKLIGCRCRQGVKQACERRSPGGIFSRARMQTAGDSACHATQQSHNPEVILRLRPEASRCKVVWLTFDLDTPMIRSPGPIPVIHGMLMFAPQTH